MFMNTENSKTSMLRSDLCAFSNGDIVVRGTIIANKSS